MSLPFLFHLLLFLASCFLSYSIISTAKWAGLKLSIHNLPYFLLGGFVMALLLKTAMINPVGYFIMGVLAGAMHFILEATDTLSTKKKPLSFRLLLSVIVGLMWIHLLAYLIFYLRNSKIINEKLKS